MDDDRGATGWDDMLADFAFTPDEQADIDQRAEQLRAEPVIHEHNADRTAANGWAYWRCTGCGELCHYSRPDLSGYDFCACCADTGTMPCLACGDPCRVTDYAEHIRTKHPSCPACLVMEGSALGTGCTCTKTE